MLKQLEEPTVDSEETESRPPSEMQLRSLPRDLWRFVMMMYRFEPQMLEKILQGSSILEVGGGDGANAVPFLLAADSMGAKKTQYLLTDVLDYKGAGLTFPEIWKWQLSKKPEGFVTEIGNKRPSIILDEDNFPKIFSRIKNISGEEWDATKAEIFEKAKKVLQSEIGLIVLRHPEIGTDDVALTEIFIKIINNLLSELMHQDVPVLITSSNNSLSWKRILEAVRQFFIQADFDQTIISSGDMSQVEESGFIFTKGKQKYVATWEDRGDFFRDVGGRKLDFNILRIYKES